MGFFQGTQERARNSRVRAIEIYCITIFAALNVYKNDSVTDM